MLLVNFKTYPKATGNEARKIARELEKASRKTGKNIVAAPAPEDLLRLEGSDLKVFSQHIDPEKPGSHTGHLLPEQVQEAGASGTLINHSERRIDRERIQKAVERARETGLTTVVCGQSPEEVGKLSEFKPDYVAFEPPELIGGNTSVSEAEPELIENAVERSEVDVLTGAGIHTRKDVEKSLELGCEGVLVASGVVKAENVFEEAVELCEGL